MSYGAQLKFGIARQASAGTAVSAAGSFHGFPLVSEDIGLTKEEVISQNLTGRFAEGAVYDGVNRIDGTAEAEITPRNLGVALAAAINHAPVSVTSASIRTYTFLPNTQDFSSTLVKAPFTIYKQFSDSNSAEQYFDVQFGQLEVSLSQGQLNRLRITANGGTRTANGVGSANVLPAASDIGRLFPWNVASVTWGGNPMDSASDISVTVNENIDVLYTLNGTLAPYKFTRTAFREVSVRGTFYMNSRDLANDFVDGTQRRLLITMMNTRAAIQSGYYDTLTIDVPQTKVTQFKPGAQGPGELAVSFTARGVTDSTSDYQVQFTLTNTYQAGY